ncbi:MAG TPA: TRAP transporter small permease [Deltaproteobacteria bacterium]|nr:TRAP transporter small permease [Deltaproteobacteria bacterium]
MLSFIRVEKWTALVSEWVNWVAAAAVVFMMLLITADVTLRYFFNSPLRGTYEVVGLVGSVVVAFALPYTTVCRGHIAVDFLAQRLPWIARVILNIVNTLAALILFSFASWECGQYAQSLKASGEVSATLQMPTYPFIYGVAIGFAMLCVVLVIELIRQFRGAEIE